MNESPAGVEFDWAYSSARDKGLCRVGGAECQELEEVRYGSTARYCGIRNGEHMNSQLIIFNLIPAMWFAWALYWVILARKAKHTVRRESLASRATNVVPLVIGVLLVAVPSIPSPA